jgi:hypothetical protein
MMPLKYEGRSVQDPGPTYWFPLNTAGWGCAAVEHFNSRQIPHTFIENGRQCCNMFYRADCDAYSIGVFYVKLTQLACDHPVRPWVGSVTTAYEGILDAAVNRTTCVYWYCLLQTGRCLKLPNSCILTSHAHCTWAGSAWNCHILAASLPLH